MAVPIALYPGSFDPFHLGHLDVVEQAHQLWEQVIVCVLRNPRKPDTAFTPKERCDMISASVAHLSNVTVCFREGLLANAMKELGASVIVRGLRTVTDYDSETVMAQTNRALSGLATVFIPCDPAKGFLASSHIRDIARLNGDVSSFVPTPVIPYLKDV
jgi:pantetheine-phosphate adenylyltransferase